MEAKELMEKLFGKDAPYPGQEVEWECFAGQGSVESGIYSGKVTEIRWCEHCGFPAIHVESHQGARFSVKISKEGRLVCGWEAPK